MWLGFEYNNVPGSLQHSCSHRHWCQSFYLKCPLPLSLATFSPPFRSLCEPTTPMNPPVIFSLWIEFPLFVVLVCVCVCVWVYPSDSSLLEQFGASQQRTNLLVVLCVGVSGSLCVCINCFWNTVCGSLWGLSWRHSPLERLCVCLALVGITSPDHL